MNVTKKVQLLIILLWIATAACVLMGVVSIPHYYCLLPFLMAVLLPPIPAYQRKLKMLFPKKWMKPCLLCILLLAFVFAFTAPLWVPVQNPDILVNNETIAKSAESENYGTLEIHFIDVGQGDATLLCSDEHYILIDGGDASCSSLIYSYLSKLKIDHLDYIICTHPHEDHVGGLPGALNYCTAEKAFCSVLEYDTKVFNSFLKYLNKGNVLLQTPEINVPYRFGNAHFTVLGPLNMDTADVNNLSLVVKVCHGENSFLIMADAEIEEENDVLKKYKNLNCSVLRVGHHGSDSSNSDEFIQAVLPQYAVISVGKDNQYGHPSENVLNKFKEKNITVYRTDLQGDIVMCSDGKNITITTEKS